jgi:hypothetical protein
MFHCMLGIMGNDGGMWGSVFASKKKKQFGGYKNTMILCVNPKTKRHNSPEKIPLFLIDSVWIASSYIGICFRGG